jgi:hypothetical protein
MTEFNIQGSKIEQLNESGNNYKITGGSGNMALSDKGSLVQTIGDQNKVQVNEKPSFWGQLWVWIRACWKWIAGWWAAS